MISKIFFQIYLAFALLMISKIVYFPSILKQAKIWQSRSACRYVVRKATLTLDWNGHVSVIVAMNQNKVSNGLGRINAMTDVLEILTKFVEGLPQWAYGQLPQNIFMDFAWTTSQKIAEYWMSTPWQVSWTWPLKAVALFVKDGIF